MGVEDVLAETVRAAVRDALALRPAAPAVLTLQGAADYLATSPAKVRALIDSDQLPCLRIGSGYRIGVAQLEELLARGGAVRGVA